MRRKQLVKMQLLALLFFSAASTPGQVSKPAQSTKPANPDSVHDLFSAPPFESKISLLSEKTVPKTSKVQVDITALQNLQKLTWPKDDLTLDGLSSLVSQYLTSMPPPQGCSLRDENQAYLFHITHWSPTADAQFRLTGSSWYAYKFSKSGILKFSGFTGSGDQLVYAKTRALVVGIAGFDSLSVDTKLDDFKETYSVATVQGTPENLQDLGLLLSALGGFANTGAQGVVEAEKITPFVVSIGCQVGTAKLPYTMTVTDSTVAKPAAKGAGAVDKSSDSSAQPGAVNCSAGMKTPCSSSHDFVSKDREFWDVSIGITTPGTRETKYVMSNGAVQTSVTRHTDFYGMFDVFPCGWKFSKDSGCPHFNVGLPLTGQTFYRPYFGIAENLTGWTGIQKTLKLPVGINFFAGVIYMKTHYVVDDPVTQAEFSIDNKSTRVWKGVFGIEVPISAMVSKIGKSGSSKSSSKTGGS
jgi:hypothetical protein